MTSVRQINLLSWKKGERGKIALERAIFYLNKIHFQRFSGRSDVSP